MKREWHARVDWDNAPGRELNVESWDQPADWNRLVACLNVWNDLPALQATLASWAPHVDHVIAVDGSYPTIGDELSTDGTREYLSEHLLDRLTIIDAAGATQLQKRNLYLHNARPGDMLFVVDADELVEGLSALTEHRLLFEVGWVRIRSFLYERSYGQPRLFRNRPGMEYRGRHHWLYRGAQLLGTHQYNGAGVESRTVNVTLTNQRGLGHSKARRTAKRTHSKLQHTDEATLCADAPRTERSDTQIAHRESLRIAAIAMRDDGMAPSRLHTAINRTTPHSSLFFKTNEGPFGVDGQFSTDADFQTMRDAVRDADILHTHVPYWNRLILDRWAQHLVIHHHGTPLRTEPDAFRKDYEHSDALVLVSNLNLLQFAPYAHYLENPVPVAMYQRIRSWSKVAPWTGEGVFRVVHTPSKEYRKGTEALRRACQILKAKGLPIELSVITGMDHSVSLIMKSMAHVCFDSFDLGMQCSGLEAAAMGIPVIAGDAQVMQANVERYGYCPYIFAGDEARLVHELHLLMIDPSNYARMAQQSYQHVLHHHDEAVVALRYLDLLDNAFAWRS